VSSSRYTVIVSVLILTAGQINWLILVYKVNLQSVGSESDDGEGGLIGSGDVKIIWRKYVKGGCRGGERRKFVESKGAFGED
jgi:hypothetical protein